MNIIVFGLIYFWLGYMVRGMVLHYKIRKVQSKLGDDLVALMPTVLERPNGEDFKNLDEDKKKEIFEEAMEARVKLGGMSKTIEVLEAIK